jgi:hypothetical protein
MKIHSSKALVGFGFGKTECVHTGLLVFYFWIHPSLPSPSEEIPYVNQNDLFCLEFSRMVV